MIGALSVKKDRILKQKSHLEGHLYSLVSLMRFGLGFVTAEGFKVLTDLFLRLDLEQLLIRELLSVKEGQIAVAK